MKESHLDRILGRLDDLDASNLNLLIHHLMRERHLLETVFDKVREGIILVNKEGALQYWNSAAERLVGLNDMTVGESFLWKAVPELKPMFPLSQESSSVSSREMELRYPRKRYVRFYVVPMEETKKGFKTANLYTILLSDITQEREITEEMIENEKFASIFRLAAGVAHEIGNPLNSIGIHLQLMRRKLSTLKNIDGYENLEKSLSVCEQEVDRLDKIIENFLKAIRPNGVDLRDVILLEVLSETIKSLQEELNDRKIHVAVELEEDIPLVLGDSVQMGQVFYNILKNAIDAIGNEGSVEIKSIVEDDFVSLSFRDTGVGIPQDQIAQVFEAYESTKDTGYGLGMMIVQRIVREHGGQIGIDSKQGIGTTVTVKFPRKEKRVKLLQD